MEIGLGIVAQWLAIVGVLIGGWFYLAWHWRTKIQERCEVCDKPTPDKRIRYCKGCWARACGNCRDGDSCAVCALAGEDVTCS